MKKAQVGDTVTIHVTGKLKDGTVCFTTENNSPFQFKIGGGKYISGLENAVIGMQPGDRKTTIIHPLQAFGDHSDRYVFTIEKGCIPHHITPKVGMELDMGKAENVHKTRVKITEVTASSVTIDTNHPLAGKPIVLDVKLLEIK